MSQYVLLYVTCPEAGLARKIARILVEERLVACANLRGEHTAIYRWKGLIDEAPEVSLILKTQADLIGACTQRIKALHGDEVPCVVALPILGGNPDFLAWITRETRSVDDL
jgi:periplasmic divalent cation tolerance protein